MSSGSATRERRVSAPPWRNRAVLFTLAIGSAQAAYAKPEFLGLAKSTLLMVKGGKIDQASCSLCHAPSGPPDLNPFGLDLQKGLRDHKTAALTKEILLSTMNKDSDEDGYTNEEEFTADTLPGDPKSHPAAHPAKVEAVQSAAAGSDQAPNPFSPTAILLAKDAQHPAIVHFPIALFMVSVFLDALGAWKKNSGFIEAAAINLLLGALSAAAAVVTGLLAWRLKFEGAPLTGNLLLHLIGGLITTAVIWTLLLMRKKFHGGRIYWALAAIGLLAVSATGHLGGVVSGVAN